MNKKFLILALVLLAIIACLYGAYRLSKSRNYQVLGELFIKGNTQEKVIALTFDDGPSKHTESILTTLDELDIKATFYLTGHELTGSPDFGKAIAEAGHEIGNHSFSHQRMVFKSYDFIKDEVDQTNELIRETGYDGPITFRPPYLKRLVLLPHYLNQEDITTVTWSMEPETYLGKDTSAQDYIDYMIQRTEPGTIILLHPMYKNHDATMAAVIGYVETMKDEGYEFVTIQEMMRLSQ